MNVETRRATPQRGGVVPWSTPRVVALTDVGGAAAGTGGSVPDVSQTGQSIEMGGFASG